MKVCSICGCHNADDAGRCSICGVNFPKVESPVAPPRVAEASVIMPAPAPAKLAEDNKPDRMALAGFILSLMGFFTCMTSPLQLAALILSISAGRAKKFRALRLIGIILSAVALGVSLILWLTFAVNADAVMTYITDVMNEFYYYY